MEDRTLRDRTLRDRTLRDRMLGDDVPEAGPSLLVFFRQPLPAVSFRQPLPAIPFGGRSRCTWTSSGGFFRFLLVRFRFLPGGVAARLIVLDVGERNREPASLAFRTLHIDFPVVEIDEAADHG